MEQGAFSRISEHILFKLRGAYIILAALLTVWFAWEASQVKLDASLEKMVPLKHEYIQNLFKHKDELSLGNDLKIAIETVDGDIFTKEFLEVVRKVTDEAFYVQGVDKSKIQSLWTANVRWVEVTEEGFRGGEVIPPEYDGSAEQLAVVQKNVLRSGQLGRLVGDNFKSTIVYVPLVDLDPKSGEKHDYQEISHQIEEKIRDKYQTDKVKIRVVGFAKKMGDMLDGANEVAKFFFITVVLTFVFLLIDTRCMRSTIIITVSSMVAVIWQIGVITILGFGIDPYSMLIPFLMFAIAVSHSVQIVTTFADEKVAGQDNYHAARSVFRSLFAPGAAALVSDAIGFFSLYIIEIRVIQELAIAAGIGTLIVTFTNLILVKLIMSYTGVSAKAIARSEHAKTHRPKIWIMLAKFANPKVAAVSIFLAACLGVTSFYISKDLKTGDLDPGAPELHPHSRYNMDDKYINSNYSVSADVLVVMVETPPDKCTSYRTLEVTDRFMWFMENVEGVQGTVSVTTVSKRVLTGYNEGNLKWQEISKIPDIINNSVQNLPSGLMNLKCSLVPVIIYLNDHTAETLYRATSAVKQFALQNDDPSVAVFVLASGNAGVEAATNETIKKASNTMLWFVYGIVVFMCWITFNYSMGAVICVVTPLVLTSILCEALMTLFGMGVKVGTLPVIALGVGIGVDYGIYIYSKMQEYLAKGMSVQESYLETLCVTGKAVAFTGVSLAVGTGTWIFSEIKFQADMGILLTFMFLWNMVGALWLLPAMADLLIRVTKRQ
jgi:predicted RND superfamily exporter protein